MANIVPNAVRNHIAAGTWNPGLATATVKCALIDSGVVTPLAAHTFLSDVSAGVVGTAQTLTSKTFGTVGVGVMDGANVTFPDVVGNTCEYLVLYVDTGNASTSQIIIFIDQATGLPATPNGEDITVTWHATGIYST